MGIKLSKKSASPKRRILLGQLGAMGDCLYATAIARQIKHDYPDCHLTWAIGSNARSILVGNPDVDDIWEFPVANHNETKAAWQKFEREAIEAKRRGEFDDIFLTQVYPNFKNFDGTIRYSMFRGYPKPVTVPVEPVIFLTSDEVENVYKFAKEHKLEQSNPVILFECSTGSGQSFVSPEFAVRFSQKLINFRPDARIILSSNKSIQTDDDRIIDGSQLSFRENAELTKYCSLLIGGSSGISWLCTSNWAKPLPMIQLLKKSTSVFASFVHDYEHRGADTSLIIEMTDCSPDKLLLCTTTILLKGFAFARDKFHEQIPLNFNYYNEIIIQQKVSTIVRSIICTLKRYGLNIFFIRSFLTFLMQRLLKI
jgi:ADP-heptose:LPS heptosyltransferase